MKLLRFSVGAFDYPEISARECCLRPAKRTAREITAELSDYIYKRGWISEDKWIEPKHERATDTW